MPDSDSELTHDPALGSLYRVNSVFLKARPKVNETPGWGRFWEMIPNDSILLVLSSSMAGVVFTPITGHKSIFSTFLSEFKSSTELISGAENESLDFVTGSWCA